MGVDLFRISIFSILILSLFVFSYIGILPLYYDWDPWYSSWILKKNIVLEIFFYSTWTIFAISLGYVLMKAIVFRASFLPQIPLRPLKKVELILFFLLISAIYTILFLYISKLDNIALFEAIWGDTSNKGYYRSEMGNNFSGKYHYYKLFMHDLFTLVTFGLFANLLINKNKATILLFLISFLGASFVALMATEKSPIGWLFIGLFLVYSIVRKNGYVKPFSALKVISFISIPLIMTYIYFGGISKSEEIFKAIVSRIFSAQIAPSYYYIQFFPYHHDYLWGMSFDNPGGIFPYTPFRLSVEISNWISPDLVTKGIIGSQPTVFWGELYANFGTFGVISFPVFIGIYIFIISSILEKLENTPLKVGLLVWLCLHFKNLALGGIGGYILDFFLVSVLSIFFVIVLISAKGKIKFKTIKLLRI